MPGPGLGMKGFQALPKATFQFGDQYIIRIGHRLADIEMMRPTGENSALEVITQRPMHRGLLGGAPIWIWRDQG